MHLGCSTRFNLRCRSADALEIDRLSTYQAAYSDIRRLIDCVIQLYSVEEKKGPLNCLATK